MRDERHLVHIVHDDAADHIIGDAVLRDHGFHTRIWPSSADFLEAFTEAEPGCVVVDCGPRGDVTSAMAVLGRKPRLFPTIVLGRHDDIAAAIDIMRAGAVDFLVEPLDPPALIAAVERTMRRLADKHRRYAAMRNARRLVDALSPRERDVLECLIRGASNKIIARDLGISARTVEIHRARIMSKLGATSLPMVIQIAFFAGFFLPGEDFSAVINTLETTGSYV